VENHILAVNKAVRNTKKRTLVLAWGGRKGAKGEGGGRWWNAASNNRNGLYR